MKTKTVCPSTVHSDKENTSGFSHQCLQGGRGSAGKCRSRSWAAELRWRWCCSVYCWWCRAERIWRDTAGPRWTRCKAPAVTERTQKSLNTQYVDWSAEQFFLHHNTGSRSVRLLQLPPLVTFLFPPDVSLSHSSDMKVNQIWSDEWFGFIHTKIELQSPSGMTLHYG